VLARKFEDISLGSSEDLGNDISGKAFSHAGVNLRQVTGRNTPSVIMLYLMFATSGTEGRVTSLTAPIPLATRTLTATSLLIALADWKKSASE